MGNITFNASTGAKRTKSGSKSATKKTRSGKKKGKATLEPAVRYLRYELTNHPTPGTERSFYIDLAKDLSAINRRLYRQGRCYHVKRVSIVSSNTIAGMTHVDQSEIPGVSTFTQNAGRVTLSTIPYSWSAVGAWKRAFKAWQKMQALVVDATGTKVTPTWNDFRVYLSNDHRTGTVLNPLDNGGNGISGGDWSYSRYHSPDGTTSADTFNLHMLGAHVGSSGSFTSIGLIQSYGDGRATVQLNNPNVPAALDDDPIANLFDDGTQVDEIAADLRTIGEDAPYDTVQYPGSGSNHPKPLVVQQTTLGADGRASVGGFTAMCGLIEVETTSPIEDDVYSILVELAPGKFRGIAADVI